MSAPETAAVATVGKEVEVSNMSIRVQAEPDKLAFLPAHVRNPILAFHSEIVGNSDWTWKRVSTEIGYDSSTMSKAFRGKYGGSYEKISASIVAFFDKQDATAAPSEFVQNPIAKTIWNALDYARANHTGALVIGPARTGKTVAAKQYAARKDEQRLPISTYIRCWPTGGIGALRLQLCQKLGVAPRLVPYIADAAIIRSQGRRRVLIVDEAHLLATAANASKIVDYVRMICDESGCGFAVIATVRFEDALLESSYMFEQFIGRIEAPIRVGETIEPSDWQPIADQFIPGGVAALREETVQALARIAAASGHLASIVHVMHLAQRDASHRKQPLADVHVANAIRWRREKFNQKFFTSQRGGKP